MEEGLTPGQAGVGEPKPSGGGGGQGLPGRGRAPRRVSYLRVVGVGIVVPPGSVQREQHRWAAVLPPGRAQGRSTAREGPGAFLLGRGLARG